MFEIEFIYNQTKVIIQCNLNDKMKDILQKLIIKIEKKKDEVYFLYDGKIIEEELTLKDIINTGDSQKNKIQILVNDILEDEMDENECFKPAKNIICPNCKECIRISIHDYKIKLFDCKNKHLTDNIPFNQFESTQMINEKKIICQKCKTSNKNDTYENKFFRCLNCKINLCPLCKASHDKMHNIIDYEQKYFICDLHNETFNSYCKDCSKDICIICENEHINHNIISFGRIMPNIKLLNEEIYKQREKIHQFINGIEEIINKLNNLIENIEDYYKIYENLLNNYEIKNRNFSILQNIIDLRNYNNNFYKAINTIIDEKNMINKFSYLIDIYDKITLNDNSNNISNKKEQNTEIKNNNLDNNKNDSNKMTNENKIINDKIAEKNEINLPENDKNLEEKKNNIINDKDIINENINTKNDLTLSKNEKNSDIIKKEEINNFENFDVTKMKEKDSYGLQKKIEIICKLKNEKVAIIDEEKKFYVFNIINSGIKCIFNVNLDIPNAHDIIQLDDGNLIISGNDIHLFKLNENGIENIEKKKVYSTRLYKSPNEKLIIYDSPKIILYSYENGKIIDQNYSFEISELKYKSNIIYDLFNGVTFTSFNDLIVLNENEILIFYTYVGIGNNNRSHYFLFYNIKKGKKIKSIKIGSKDQHSATFSFFDKNYLLASYDKKIFLIDIKDHSIKKTFSLENDACSYSSISLNEKFILVTTHENGYFISQYEIENLKKLKFKCKKKIKSKFYKFIGKCNGNNLIIKEGNEYGNYYKFIICG